MTRARRAFAIRPAGIEEAVAPRARERGPGVRRHTLVGCPLVGRRITVLGWRAVRFPARGFTREQRPRPPRAPSRPSCALAATVAGTAGNSLWRLRGFLDLLAGGVGMRRGRRTPPASAWVMRSISGASRRSSRTGGCGWSPRCACPGAPGWSSRSRARRRTSTIRQTAIFDPVGLAGLAYWYALYPVHQLVFGGMLRGIAAAAARDVKRQQG